MKFFVRLWLIICIALGVLNATDSVKSRIDSADFAARDSAKSAPFVIAQNATDSANRTKDSARDSATDSATIKRVFAFSPPATALLEILYPQGMIGLNYKPYPEDVVFMPPNVAELPVLGMFGGGKQVLFEKIIALKPNVLIFSTGTQREIYEQYEKFGIKIVLVDSHNAAALRETIMAYDEALNIGAKARNLIAFMDEINAKMKEADAKITRRPSVYLAQGINGLSTQCGDENRADDLVRQIGGRNAIQCATLTNPSHISQINFETLLKANPEVIFVREIGLYKDIMRNPSKEWQQLNAVKNGKVFYAPSTPSNWLMKPPSAMQIIGIPWAFAKVQPEILSDSWVRERAFAFFKAFLREIDEDDYLYIEGKIER